MLIGTVFKTRSFRSIFGILHYTNQLLPVGLILFALIPFAFLEGIWGKILWQSASLSLGYPNLELVMSARLGAYKNPIAIKLPQGTLSMLMLDGFVCFVLQ